MKMTKLSKNVLLIYLSETRMKTIILLVAGLLIRTTFYAQTETVSRNGKTYYVYPHQQQLSQAVSML
mgnify:CR=1 FL=1